MGLEDPDVSVDGLLFCWGDGFAGPLVGDFVYVEELGACWLSGAVVAAVGSAVVVVRGRAGVEAY